MAETFSRYDTADYLRTDEDIAAYLEAATEVGDPDMLVAALATVARIAKALGLRLSVTTREGAA